MTTPQNKIFVLLVAGGNGSRFGSTLPKQYTVIGNKPVLRITLDVLRSVLPVEQIKVVINPDHQDFYHAATEDLSFLPPPAFCGLERQSSVLNGLKSLQSVMEDNDIILIHDAARPLLHKEDLENVIKTAQSGQACVLARAMSDSLCYSDHNHNRKEHVSRENLWALQTPQAFTFGKILAAHEKQQAHNHLFTDDTALYEATYPNEEIKIIPARHPNFKITTQEDFKLAENILSEQSPTETCTGLGFDVHAFDETAHNVTSIRLCGIDIPFARKLKGHSDADVGLHALTDAIYGALCEGDIGLHFPPSDMTFKDMDSAIFLRHALDLIKEKQGKLIHADITLMCEKPKIGPHREAIQDRLCALLNLSKNRVNIKATTTEKLGFTGREEGIAAQAIVTIKLPAYREE